MSPSTEIFELESSLQVKGKMHDGYDRILTTDAMEFLSALHQQFNARRIELLQKRKVKQQLIDAGHFPEFSKETKEIRESDWKVSPVPKCLEDRRVEITGPVDRKMIINALNSGAKVFMADFEDSTSPTWENIIDGQLNLYDAVRKNIDFSSGDKTYSLNKEVAVLHVRPRGWHLDESHLHFNELPASASLTDFGLFAFHNAKVLAQHHEGPFFYLPKLENHIEARLWNDVFSFTEEKLQLPKGIIKATVLIETITAAFEMEEILYELRTHIAGLNAGRWDYIFSMIKKFRSHSEFVTPDRLMITMNAPFMKAYAELLVKVCHKRGAHAIGGMSAFIPSKDESINKNAFDKVRADKEREASQGYDGTWVAHPKLVSVACEAFDKRLGDQPNQKNVLRDDVKVTAKELLNVASLQEKITETGFRVNINVTLLYLESWLRGIGAVALYNLMEDAATAEISRAQLWQWINHRAKLDDGRMVTTELYLMLCGQEFQKIRNEFVANAQDTVPLATARLILDRLVLNKRFEDFLTTHTYLHIL
jgi:malate synthase